MEDVKLYVERVGVDPASGADIRIARRESTSWHKDIVAELINQVAPVWCNINHHRCADRLR